MAGSANEARSAAVNHTDPGAMIELACVLLIAAVAVYLLVIGYLEKKGLL